MHMYPSLLTMVPRTHSRWTLWLLLCLLPMVQSTTPTLMKQAWSRLRWRHPILPVKPSPESCWQQPLCNQTRHSSLHCPFLLISTIRRKLQVCHIASARLPSQLTILDLNRQPILHILLMEKMLDWFRKKLHFLLRWVLLDTSAANQSTQTSCRQHTTLEWSLMGMTRRDQSGCYDHTQTGVGQLSPLVEMSRNGQMNWDVRCLSV